MYAEEKLRHGHCRLSSASDAPLLEAQLSATCFALYQPSLARRICVYRFLAMLWRAIFAWCAWSLAFVISLFSREKKWALYEGLEAPWQMEDNGLYWWLAITLTSLNMQYGSPMLKGRRILPQCNVELPWDDAYAVASFTAIARFYGAASYNAYSIAPILRKNKTCPETNVFVVLMPVSLLSQIYFAIWCCEKT